MKTFNVMDYGAVGDRQHDDAPAFRRAIAAAQAASGTVTIPLGMNFRIGSPVDKPRDTRLEGGV